MESVIDIEAIVAPLSDDNPCGEDPRNNTSFDSPYHKLKDAREEAMAVERPDRSAQPEAGQGGQITDPAKWQSVVDNALSILLNEAKDLEVCALLIEALARVAGPAGIRDGVLATARLIDNHWEELFPRLDPDDEDSLDDRLAAFTGINGVGQPGTLAVYITKLPVTDSAGDNFRGYDYNRAWQLNNNTDPESREQEASELGYSLEDIDAAASDTPASFFVDMHTATQECLSALQMLDSAFTEACGNDAPSTNQIANALDDFTRVIVNLGGDALASGGVDDAGSSAASNSEQGSSRDAGKKQAGATGPIASREDAVNRLRTVAQYFRDTEPHSPISYSLQNLIRWSQLPLDKLVEEWIQDSDARERYLLMTGMRTTRDSEEDDY